MVSIFMLYAAIPLYCEIAMDEAAGNMQMGIRTSHEQMPQTLDWFTRIARASLNPFNCLHFN
jgi:hypothetical protein